MSESNQQARLDHRVLLALQVVQLMAAARCR